MSRASLVKRLNSIPAKVKAAVVPSLLASAGEIADGMKALVPVKTGHLRNSIVVTPPGGMTPTYSQGGGARTVPENKVAVSAGNSAVRYAHLVEFGTERTHAQPFFWPAYRLYKKRAANRIKRAISKAVKETKMPEIDIILDGDKMQLVPSLNAAQQLSKKYNGMVLLCDYINAGYLDAAVDVVWFGLGAVDIERKELAEKIYKTGLSKLAPKLVRYVILLMNGGREPEVEAPKDV